MCHSQRMQGYNGLYNRNGPSYNGQFLVQVRYQLLEETIHNFFFYNIFWKIPSYYRSWVSVSIQRAELLFLNLRKQQNIATMRLRVSIVIQFTRSKGGKLSGHLCPSVTMEQARIVSRRLKSEKLDQILTENMNGMDKIEFGTLSI